jgi:hypothetical protein
VTIKVRIVFRQPTDNDCMRSTPIIVKGIEVPFTSLTVDDLTHRIAETEAHLSRIMGLTVKIETASE